MKSQNDIKSVNESDINTEKKNFNDEDSGWTNVCSSESNSYSDEYDESEDNLSIETE